MKKRLKAKSPAVPKVDPYLEGLMTKLLERLVGLEKKMDRVIAQTGSSSGGEHPKPFQIPPANQPSRHNRQLYEAICADCSKVCEVPFQPSENRAVYCKACWAKRKGQAPGMPILRPVSTPPKPAGKLHLPIPTVPVSGKPKKAKKSPPKKKAKKKK